MEDRIYHSLGQLLLNIALPDAKKIIVEAAITEDINLVNAIFSIIDNGIIDGYDSFRYEVVLGQGFVDTELLVEKDGMATTNARTDLDDIRLYDLIDQLQQRAQQRGEHWTSLTISYRQAGQVTAQFHQ